MIGFGGAQHAWSRSDCYINVLYFDSMTCGNKKVGFVELEKGILFAWYSRGPFSPYNQQFCLLIWAIIHTKKRKLEFTINQHYFFFITHVLTK